MTTIFLDIDGVLHGYGQHDRRREMQSVRNEAEGEAEWTWFYPEQTALLNQICEATDAEIVVHSAWRFSWNPDELRELFRSVGIVGQVIGIADRSIHDRGVAIRAWLQEHPTVRRYVVLDDEDLRDEPVIGDNAVAVDGQIGLTDKDVTLALRILRVGP